MSDTSTYTQPYDLGDMRPSRMITNYRLQINYQKNEAFSPW